MCLSLSCLLLAEDKHKTSEDETKQELTLEKLFPEKSFFGPSARSTAFSFDSKYAAYLYHPHKERRHGLDLWIYDVAKAKARRITSVSVMAKFQESTRKVKEDRIKKAKEAAKKKDSREQEADKNKIKDKGKDKDKEKTKTKRENLNTKETKRDTDKKDDRRKKKKLNKNKESEKVVSQNPYSQPEKKKTEEKSVKSSKKRDQTDQSSLKADKKKAVKKRRDDTDTDKKSDEKKKKVQKRKNSSKTVSKKQADKSGKKSEKKKIQKEEEKKEQNLGDWVSETDADDKKAPRYSGISSFTWSPKADELLFVSEGDVYRYNVIDDKLTRLTRTREREQQVAWLPDASGYTFMRGRDLMKVNFGSYLAEQLYVKLPDAESMTRYKISPNVQRMAFLTLKELPDDGERGKKVKIAQYRKRFMEVKEVSRQVSDDPIKTREQAVYIYEMNDPMLENGRLTEVYRHTLKQPRDFVKVPEWSPDSERAVFAVYDQVSGHVNILEATCPDEPDTEDKDTSKKAKENDSTNDKDKENTENDDDADKDKKEEDKNDTTKKNPAKVVHRFLHSGGPTTPRMIRPYYLADNRRIVYLSEQTGFRHLHVLDPVYQSTVPLTKGHFEVYPIEITKDHNWMFVTATKEHPARLDVYRVSLEDGTMTRLSKKDGYYSTVAVSPDGTRVLANFTHFGKPLELVSIDAKSKKQKQLTDSHPPIAHELTKPSPEFFSYLNRHQQEIHGFMFKPDDLKKDEKRPLLIYLYGGPLGTRKSVVDGSYQSSAYFFAYYMTQKHGYITCTIDPRGNSGYGGLFENANFDQVGKPQVEDIVDGVKYLIENHNVDPNRTAIHGWSFGGFQTQMCLYTEPDVFAAGIAGAGPTEWENYNSWYTSGTIGISEPGTAELKKFSLLPLAKNLKAKLLLVHGMEDSNVLYQDTIRMYRELIKAGKETLVELFLDPSGGHGLGGDVKKLARYRKYEDFLLSTIGTAKSSD